MMAGKTILAAFLCVLGFMLAKFAYYVTDKPNNGYFEFVVSGVSWSLTFSTIAQGILLLLRGQWLWDFLRAPF